MTTMNVGDKVYRFDGNVRVYDRAGFGGAAIYEKHFVEEEIIGETNRSWITSRGYKISKKDGSCPAAMQYAGRGFFTFQAMQDDIWRNNHRHKIERLLGQASAHQLRQVADILGYQP